MIDPQEDMQPTQDLAPQDAPDRAPAAASPEPSLNEKSLPKSTPDNQEREFKAGEVEQGITPTTSQRWANVFNKTADSLPIGLPGSDVPGTMIRSHVQDSVEQDSAARGVMKLSPEEANKRFPGMPQAYTEPVDPYVAQLQYDDMQARQKREEWSRRGGGDPWGSNLAAGLIGGVADPVNLALTYATGGIAKAVGLSQGFTLAGARNVFAQNLAVNLATGIPSYLQEKRERQDVSVPDMIGGAVEGALGGTAFHYGMATFSKLIGRYARSTPLEEQVGNTKEVINQMENQVTPDLTPQMAESAARNAGVLAGQESPYRFTPSEHPSDRGFFMSKGAGNATPVEFSPYARGAHAVDNPLIANHAASLAEGDAGRIARIDVDPGSKMLDLEQSASAPEGKPLVDAVEAKLGTKLDLPEGATLKDVLNQVGDLTASGEVPADALDQIQAMAKEQGYAGYKYVENGANGQPSHNGVVMFDSQHPVSEQYASNPELVPSLSGDQLQAHDAELGTPGTAANLQSPELDQQIHELKHGPVLNSTPDYMQDIVKEQYTQAKAQLQKLAETSPTAKAALETLQRSEADGKQELEMMKQIANCVGENLA